MEEEKIKLEPCPFCGEKARICGSDEIELVFIECTKCYSQTNTYKTDKEAIKAWNRRVE